MKVLENKPLENKPNDLVANLPGGLGKQIAATAFLRAWRDANPRGALHVNTPYPDVFRNMPWINRTYPLGQAIPYFAEEHRGFEFFAGEPYHRLPFRQGKEHIVEAYCRSLGIEPPKDLRGLLKITDQEHEAAMRLMAQVDRGRPWIAFQPWGGTSFYDPGRAQDLLNPKQVRDLPADVAQAIVDRLVDRGNIVVQFSLPTERRLDKTIWIDLGQDERGQPRVMAPRVLFAVLNLCEFFVGIDSSLQHAWAALRKPAGKSAVLWGATKPANFSYPCHKDLSVENPPCGTPHCSRPDMAFGDIVDGNNVWQCSHDRACMNHNPDLVVETLLGKREPARVAEPVPPIAQIAAEEPVHDGGFDEDLLGDPCSASCPACEKDLQEQTREASA